MSTPIMPSVNLQIRLHCLIAFAAACLFSSVAPACAQTATNAGEPIAPTILTNIQQAWAVPGAEKTLLHRLKTELVIYYFDPAWNVAWGECGGQPTFLPIANAPVNFRPGQRVRLDGFVYPEQERVVWDKTRIEILDTNVAPEVIVTHSLQADSDTLKSRIVSIEGLIDHRMPGDTNHIALSFLANGTAATVFVLLGSNSPALQVKDGDLARLRCVYSPQFDRDGKLSQLTLWVARVEDVTVIGSLDADPRFDLPVTTSQEILDRYDWNKPVRVVGTVRSHEPGRWVTIWDANGQIMVRSKQTRPLSCGDRIEAIGRPFISGIDVCLDEGIYRPLVTGTANGFTDGAGEQPVLYLAEKVRDLTREQAQKHPQVKLRGVLTWVNRRTPFAYIQDASGGILVANPRWDGDPAGAVGTVVNVCGEVAQGDFVPIVTNAVMTRVGWWNASQAKPVSFEQAMTGLEDSQWVEMRGYVRSVTITNSLYCFDLSTSGGEFKVWTSRSTPYEYLKGAIVRVQGVCDAVTDSKQRLTGIQLWVPETQYITVEEPAPGDPFDVPMRSMGSLRRFNLQNALNQRVRIGGTVVLHAPGSYLYVQDGEESVLALSRGRDELRPGDKVEVVGLAGVQGRRFLLREATFRRVESGAEPAPIEVPLTNLVNPDFAGLLTTAKGTLLNRVEKDNELHLLMQTSETAFEAALLLPKKKENAPKFELGSQLALTGVYEVQSDDNGMAHSFVVRLRSWKDITVLHSPPWWTLKKLVWVLFVFAAVCGLVLSWALMMARKNALLRQAQAALQTANDQLEVRVQERTCELEQQVAAKERARAELAEAQKSLMLASRKAGMAEVATGVLHNVGNVLNSVNVSALLLADRIRNSRVENVLKAGALLRQQEGQLGNFLATEKGRQLPGYLQKLGESLLSEKEALGEEIQSLVKCVDHIKVIVGMQQSYAKLGGVLEELKLEELIEDAIQINNASLDRHAVRLERNFQPLPPVVTDRHKVVQILVNLISNAKHALKQNEGGKKITVSLALLDKDRVSISITDNGMGIATESIHQIFSQGFTTRKDGHGFGLHSGANAARELGGSLFVHSDGIGKGATFTLELPVISTKKISA